MNTLCDFCRKPIKRISFCSTKCRVYYHRGLSNASVTNSNASVTNSNASVTKVATVLADENPVKLCKHGRVFGLCEHGCKRKVLKI